MLGALRCVSEDGLGGKYKGSWSSTLANDKGSPLRQEAEENGFASSKV